jgi:hypothetical protein
VDFISVQVVVVIKFDCHGWKLKHNGKQGVGRFNNENSANIQEKKVSEAL